MVLRSEEGMQLVGMKRERMAWDSSGKESLDQAVCQSEGRVGMWVGIYSLYRQYPRLLCAAEGSSAHPPFGASPVKTA